LTNGKNSLNRIKLSRKVSLLIPKPLAMNIPEAFKVPRKLKNILSNLELTIFNIHHSKLIESIINQKLTYLESPCLWDLMKIAIDNERNGINGIIVEAGCALGGSSIAIASVKNKERQFFIYDVFGMIPPPSDRDGLDAHNRYKVIEEGSSNGIKENKYYGYENDLYSKVISSFKCFFIDPEENNIHLVKGLYEDNLVIDSPISFAHIDCDWYDSVMCCLHRIEPFLSCGGSIVIDDYYCYSGCKDAVDEYFFNKKDEYKFIYGNRLHIVKL
jgi:Macrocin-O-methyltransferase (TylF)